MYVKYNYKKKEPKNFYNSIYFLISYSAQFPGIVFHSDNLRDLYYEHAWKAMLDQVKRKCAIELGQVDIFRNGKGWFGSIIWNETRRIKWFTISMGIWSSFINFLEIIYVLLIFNMIGNLEKLVNLYELKTNMKYKSMKWILKFNRYLFKNLGRMKEVTSRYL